MSNDGDYNQSNQWCSRCQAWRPAGDHHHSYQTDVRVKGTGIAIPLKDHQQAAIDQIKNHGGTLTVPVGAGKVDVDELLIEMVNNVMAQEKVGLDEALLKCAISDLTPNRVKKACFLLLSRVTC